MIPQPSRRVLLQAALGAAMAALAPMALAQAKFPAKPVTIVVPYPPGGSNDTFARELGKKLTDRWGVPVIVENRAGAGGSIGAAVVSKAAPDGYTLCLLSSSFTTNAAIQANLPFDPVAGFSPVGMVAKGPMLLTVANHVPAKTPQELIALARKDPGKLNYGSSGQGSTNHFATELFMDAAGIKMTHVPYKGDSPSIVDVMSGTVDVALPTAIAVMNQVKAGKVRAIAVTGNKRLASLPDVPTVAETLPGYEAVSWGGVMAPAGTPPEIVNRLNAEINRILKMPDVQEKLEALGAVIVGSTPEEFGTYVKAEIAKWGKVAHDNNVTLE
jgi:tripartite-type tricarboxylate transporter receptor subunit TctC